MAHSFVRVVCLAGSLQAPGFIRGVMTSAVSYLLMREGPVNVTEELNLRDKQPVPGLSGTDVRPIFSPSFRVHPFRSSEWW